MASQLAKRNHYNPCFWTALWDERFFNDFCVGEKKRGTPREQVVFTLNLRSNRIFETSVDALYYDKDVCFAPITPEPMLGFCERYFPDHLAELQKSIIEPAASATELRTPLVLSLRPALRAPWIRVFTDTVTVGLRSRPHHD
jgi:hypothetical protein